VWCVCGCGVCVCVVCVCVGVYVCVCGCVLLFDLFNKKLNLFVARISVIDRNAAAVPNLFSFRICKIIFPQLRSGHYCKEEQSLKYGHSSNVSTEVGRRRLAVRFVPDYNQSCITDHSCFLHPQCLQPPVGIRLRPGRSGIESRWGRDFASVQTGTGAHPASCKMGTGSFLWVKCGRGVLLTTHPLLVSRSWKSKAIPLPTLWATPGL